MRGLADGDHLGVPEQPREGMTMKEEMDMHPGGDQWVWVNNIEANEVVSRGGNLAKDEGYMGGMRDEKLEAWGGSGRRR